MRRLEYLGTIEQGMIQSVGLAVAGVAKNRHDLHRRVDVTTKSKDELLFVPDLRSTQKIKTVSRKIYRCIHREGWRRMHHPKFFG